jgi:two-component system, LuxR family, response regulator FixJ
MPSASMVHVIDDDEAVRQSLAFLLKAAGLDACTYESAAAFLSALPDVTSGCIITDARMPEISGVDLLRRLNELEARIPVIVITGQGDIQLAVEAMKMGAADFIEKPFDDERLLASVRSALDRWMKGAQHEAERATLLDRVATLTSRERNVLDGLIAGKPTQAIAFDHGISRHAVEIDRANVMAKMSAGSLSDLVRMALVAGVLNSCREP